MLQQTPEEELCNLLTNIIFSVLWSGSGADGAGDVVWRERGQVFSVLTKLGSSCQLVRPPDDIKRRSASLVFNLFSPRRTHTVNWWWKRTGMEKEVEPHLCHLCHLTVSYCGEVF